MLVERGLLKPDQATVAAEKLAEGQSAREAIVDAGLIDDETFTSVWAELLGIPYVDLRDRTIPREVLTIIPESTARGHLLIAYAREAAGLSLAMADPSDRQIVEFVHKKVDMPVNVALASAAGIRQALLLYQQSLAAELSDIVNEELKNVVVAAPSDDLSRAADNLPIVRITQAILKHAIVEGASDIHLEPTEREVVVRYRIDGVLHDVLVLPHAVQAGLVARIKVLANLKIDEHRLPQDGRFKLEADEYKVALRVSTLPVYDGEKVVMRILDESGKGLTLDQIGIREKPLTVLRRVMQRPHGMILVTGPTGSGKTTTLYAVMQELNKPGVNISTVEDPIEYRIARVNQTQVKPSIGLTFANGLRALVRQDPDIIMVGEIRDQETAALAVNAALTGHLVLSTLHTNSAAGALPRLRDMKVEAFLLASTLNLVMAQRLVRQLCEKCRVKRKIDAALLKELAAEMDTDALLATLQREAVVPRAAGWSDVALYRYQPSGDCSGCRDGYRGRTGIYEVIEITPKLQELITPNTTTAQLEKAARESQRFITMFEDGFMKAVAGVTTLEEVLRVARE